MSVCAIMIVKDASILDYCPIQAIETALSFPDITGFYINEGYSNDDTYDRLKSIKDDRVTIYRRPWVMDKNFWSVERNFLIDQASQSNKYDYVFILDADEFVFKQDAHLLTEFVNNPGNYKGLRFPVIHYYRTKTGSTQDCIVVNNNPSWYKRHGRLFSFDINPRCEVIGHNADDIVGTYNNRRMFLHNNPLIKDSEIRIGHLGYARDAKAAGMKFKRNDEIYQHSKKYVDGCLPVPVEYRYETTSPYFVKSEWPASPEDKDDVVNKWIFSKERCVEYSPEEQICQ